MWAYRRSSAAAVRWAFLWLAALLVAHLLYAPAWAAGWVRDVSGWLQKLQEQSASDYLLRRGTRVKSLYPFSQATLWLGYKAWGNAPLPWHVAMVTAHATVAWGWARFWVAALYRRQGKKALWAGGGAGLFVLFSPYATEVVVWQAGFHYLQGSLLMLVSLGAALQLLKTGQWKWAVVALAAFVPTLFALEAFLLTPFFVALLVCSAGKTAGNYSGKVWRFVVVPMLLLCVVQYVLFVMLYEQPVPHIRTLHLSQGADWLRKPAKYVFHLFLWGRYWPAGTKQGMYAVLNSHFFLGFFGAAVILFSLLLFRRRKAFLASAWVLPTGFGLGALVLVMPLYFHQEGFVYYDRYAYFMLPAAGALGGLWVQRFSFRWVVAAGAVGISSFLLVCTVRLWQQSDALSRAMLNNIPPPSGGKITLLLNVPNALCSVPMIGMSPGGEAALMRRYVLGRPFPGLLFEPSACNLLQTTDSVQVARTGAQTLQVTALNGQGWWSGGVLSADWENAFFAVHFIPQKSAYKLTLKQPAGMYQLLVWKRGAWVRL